ncbi:hypothetical protein PF002_g32273 [Phytophthora fragariae]|uniref:RxLR effector protein n=5 Tax=Phytophthora TaxID=4783 RepID=A0A6A3V6C2_9STRA|nr:hypothetical protein PF003_g647 [Phytophthora fragariae]KAE8915753.1 hypothetical protein PF003_g639 [Phytophthora fragariae]KAE8915914.1 hypothetical protein PF003_g663 [Phytophthora fragariae]KAE8915916.1 hypothetical protein PF003_g665 [Phytophthora fragariae]KAE8915917.1 hypothetical protein PF003_g664 [Phytophthora fragariae]
MGRCAAVWGRTAITYSDGPHCPRFPSFPNLLQSAQAPPTSKSFKPPSLSTTRACYVLLVAATALLAASDAAISTASVQSTLSKVVSPDAAQPIQAEQAAANTQRFLRRHRIVDDDEEDVDSVYEERGKPPFAESRLKKALKDNSAMGKLFEQWHGNNYSLDDVAKALQYDLKSSDFEHKYINLILGYRAHVTNGYRPQ